MEPRPTRRVVLIPREPGANGTAPGPGIRRFKLARVSVDPHSALGPTRHERMEEMANRDRD